MKKFINTLSRFGRSLIKPVTIAGGAIGGYKLGTMAASRAPRIATQLPFVGMAGGAVVGAFVGETVEGRINGIRVSGQRVTLKNGNAVVRVGEHEVLVSEVERAVGAFENGIKFASDEKLNDFALNAKKLSGEPLNDKDVKSVQSKKKQPVVAGDAEEAAA